MYIIKAPKKWLEKNFDEDHIAKDGKYKVKACKKHLDSDVSGELKSVVSDLDPSIRVMTGTSNCYDISYKGAALKKIIGAALLIMAAVMIFIAIKFDTVQLNDVFGVIMCVVIVAACVVVISIFL